MSSTTHNLPYKRYVAQVSTGVPRSKSTWLSLMAENLEALKACPWREAADVEVALTPHDFTLSSYFLDVYDAFKMTGNYDSSDMTEIGYAGMAAYRFKVPTDATTRSIALSSITLPISRDRFLLGGVRIAAVLSADEEPSTDWSVVRGDGEGALVEKDVLKQTAANLLAGSPGAETVEIDLSGLASGNPADYLWIYVTLEDYTDRWQMYNATEQRLYAIEGSSMLVGDSSVATFADAVAADDDPAVLLAGGSSPTWIQPIETINAGTSAPEVPGQDAVVENFFTAAQTSTTNLTATWGFQFSTTRFSGSVEFTATGRTITQAKVYYVASGTNYVGTLSRQSDGYWLFVSSFAVSGGYLVVSVRSPIYRDNPSDATQGAFVATGSSQSPSYIVYDSATASEGNRISGSAYTKNESTFTSGLLTLFAVETYYLMLGLSNGVPSDGDVCDVPELSGRRNESVEITGGSSPWTVTIGGTSYTVTKSGSTIAMKRGTATLGTWTSIYQGVTTFFDASVAVYLNNASVANFGQAAILGDFSSVVATFEAGAQPTQAEMLGRLMRRSREAAEGMAYLHPANGAISDELDVLRPVPRFFRAASWPTGQTSCQPGLSVWYWRRATPSSVAPGLAYRGGVVSVGVVSNPAFLQLAFLALRSPKAFGRRLILENVDGAAVANGFALRFVAWRSQAAQWDGSNPFALSAMASMPSVYQADGPSSVSWQVDCTGALLPIGVRTVNAERLGVSQTISGSIADGATVEIPIVSPVGEGDVVIVAPEVLGFSDGVGDDTVTFGRQADPAGTGAAGHNYAWARYAENLGWFPRVTGE